MNLALRWILPVVAFSSGCYGEPVVGVVFEGNFCEEARSCDDELYVPVVKVDVEELAGMARLGIPQGPCDEVSWIDPCSLREDASSPWAGAPGECIGGLFLLDGSHELAGLDLDCAGLQMGLREGAVLEVKGASLRNTEFEFVYLPPEQVVKPGWEPKLDPPHIGTPPFADTMPPKGGAASIVFDRLEAIEADFYFHGGTAVRMERSTLDRAFVNSSGEVTGPPD
ncbi:MAG: hypothetical protein KC416_08045 [Myxococcales bacterium]|nr:hypothetical protein [Myxococcales bacterium]